MIGYFGFKLKEDFLCMKKLEEFLEIFKTEKTEIKKETKEEPLITHSDITHIPINKLVKVLNYLDLKYYKSVKPIDLLNTTECESFNALINKHTNLINLVKNNKKNKKYFLKLSKLLLKSNNLNSFTSIYNGLKNITSNKKLKEFFNYDDINFIREECYSEKVVIPPIKFFLNELSTYVNQSKNFYKCVEQFVKLQECEIIKVSERKVRRVSEIIESQKESKSQLKSSFDFLLWLI